MRKDEENSTQQERSRNESSISQGRGGNLKNISEVENESLSLTAREKRQKSMQSSTTKKEIRPIQDEVIDTDQILNQNIENHD